MSWPTVAILACGAAFLSMGAGLASSRAEVSSGALDLGGECHVKAGAGDDTERSGTATG